MSETRTHSLEQLNQGLIIPEFDETCQSSKTSVHEAYDWFAELLARNEIDTGLPLVLETHDDNKAVWIWRSIDDARARTVQDSHDRGTASVSARSEYHVGIVAKDSYKPVEVMKVGRSFVSQSGMLGLYPLANDEASFRALIEGEWQDAHGLTLGFIPNYEAGHAQRVQLEQQDQMVKQAIKDFISYIS
jgi:hypothetical protein